VSPSPAPEGDPSDVRLTLERVAAGLASPLFVAGAGDGSDRLFVVEQGGRIRILRDGRLLAQPFLDIAERISAGGERGLLGLAFHPGFGGDERRFYVDYTDLRGDTVVAEYLATDEPDLADPDSERILLKVDQPFPNHNGGALAFGPDGKLYIATGDGGSGGDPQDNGQRLDTLLGKLLRVDVDRVGAGPEIWAYGLRNPWRISFDRLTGDLWIGDVGQGAWEEIDRAKAGEGARANYGWRLMEGRHCFRPSTGCDQSGLVLPIAEYSHEDGCSVTGGYVYRGDASPALRGVYVFGDFCSGTIWGLAAGGPDLQEPFVLAQTDHAISSFGEDEAGEVYLTDLASGEVLRIVGMVR
jgi:glucose/arabinose dehydrogenase